MNIIPKDKERYVGGFTIGDGSILHIIATGHTESKSYIVSWDSGEDESTGQSSLMTSDQILNKYNIYIEDDDYFIV
jgi:hypothetical protein